MAQPEKRENSVLFSLRELRQIEENRVQEEEQAHRSAEEARRAAAEEAERRRREAEEAKIREERDAQLAIERARENAERERRMQVEAAEAQERARQQAALEQQRLQQEMELRRAEVAKKRPTWMLVVTGMAVVAAIVLVIFAINKMRSAESADEDKAKAEAIAAKRDAETKELLEKVEKLQASFIDMTTQVNNAIAAVDAAQGDADRASAKAKLADLQRRQAEIQAQMAAAKAAAERAQRLKGVKISKECLDNPLAKGCS
jgi:hypothetical protein